MITRCTFRAGSYYDSVVLMQLQRALAGLPGVMDAGVVMATQANRELLAAGGLEVGEAGPDDLLVSVKAESEAAAAEALSRVDALLKVRGAESMGEFRPRSLASALKQLPEARWVSISIPGRYAAAVAEEALDSGRNVFLYSDNVPIDREVALKRKAREKGLLVMGPDCGTAVLGGVGFGFANRVRRGDIGLVGASGTGLQAIMSHIHTLGAGISQAIGTGGRDLSAEVGGMTAMQGLDLLRRDSETRVIVLVAKPPAPEVASRLLALARSAGKPVVVHFLGAPLPGRRLGNLFFAATLSEAAERAVNLGDSLEAGDPVSGHVRGLFSGGTLAYEAMHGLSAFLSPKEYTIIDLGADEFTVGRLHPMIDQDLRIRKLRQEAGGIILLDVVLGEGAHADPAGELAPVISEIKAEVLVIVIGTDEDPQGLAVQIETLEKAGARVFRTVNEAVEWIFLHRKSAEEDLLPVSLESIQGPIVNVGLDSFHANLQVDWRPPAGGNEKLAGILARMKG
ncbi:MAG TPA: acyl-CoA synthetase FdrA [Thermoanaerobaculia bacterium]|nr:acyl-CoA synthetase FdrA [Thermoanaerobaculia bacterium]